MGLFEQLPYTNFSNLNLGELIKFINDTLKEIKDMSATIDEQNEKIEELWNYVHTLDVDDVVKDYIDFLISNGTISSMINSSPLANKKIIWFGDSVSVLCIPIFETMFPNVEITAVAYNGEPLTKQDVGQVVNGYTRITTRTDFNDYDYAIIMYGVNDWQGSFKLDTKAHDEYCYGGALDICLKYIKENYKTCTPLVVFPTWVNRFYYGISNNRINGALTSIEGYINHGIDICNRNNVMYVNLYTLTGINEMNYTEMLRDDVDHIVYVHPTDNTIAIINNCIFNLMCNTGKCYGENFGGNHAENIVGSLVPSVSDYSQSIRGVKKYGADIIPGTLFNMCNTTDNEVVYKVSGYISATNTNAPIVKLEKANFDFTDTTSENVCVMPTSHGDCYFEFYKKTTASYFFKWYLTNMPDSPYITLENFNIQIMNGTEDVYTESVEPTFNSTYCALSATVPKPRIYAKNGELCIESFVIDITASTPANSTLVTLPDMLPSKNYTLGVLGTNGVAWLDVSANRIKNMTALSSGNFITIPSQTLPIRTHDNA